MKKEPVKQNEEEIIIPGYKGFDKDMKCREKQYSFDSEHEEKDAEICSKGLHFCEHPFDVFNYYPPTNGAKYAAVEGSGKISKEKDSNGKDTKVAATKLKIGLELSWDSLIKGAVKFVFDRCKSSEETTATTGNRANAATTGEYANAATTGYRANAATTGYRANAATTGYSANAATTGEYANAATTGEYANAATTGNRANAATTGEYANAATTGYRANAATTGNSANAATTGEYANAATTGEYANAATTGYRANAATTGEYANAATTGNSANAATTGYRANAATTGESISASIGMEGKAKGMKGSWIVIAEWFKDDSYNWHIKEVKAIKVDGKKVKEDTYYMLKGGKLIES